MRASRARTGAGLLADGIDRALAEERANAYPLTQYQTDPVRYVLERLKEPVVMPHQEAILRALCDGIAGKADPSRPTGKAPSSISVRSAQKCGKTKVGVWACLWRFECFPNSRTFMAAAIVEQAKNVLWRELSDTIREASKRGVHIDGRLAAAPSGGLVSSDGSREIRGISGREIEALAGLSGNLFTWIDEASHLPEGKAQAFAGNTLGGGYRLLTSNPTRNVGPFWDSFHNHKDFWAVFHVDGEDVADWQERNGIRIPYVISREKIEEFRLLYGVESPFWFLRIKGDWLLFEAGRINKMCDIIEAQARYATAVDDGITSIGYDPAGVDADRGDWHVWTIVRGGRFVASHKKRGLETEAAVAETLAIVSLYRREDEWPIVNIDIDGVGGPIGRILLEEAQRRQRHEPTKAFKAFGVKPSSAKTRNPKMHAHIRDELWWRLAEWLKTGAIPPNDSYLEAELYAPSWESLPSEQVKATGKPDLRNILGRSCDAADSLALAVRNSEPYADANAAPPSPSPRARSETQNIYDTPKAFGNPADWQRSFMPGSRPTSAPSAAPASGGGMCGTCCRSPCRCPKFGTFG